MRRPPKWKYGCMFFCTALNIAILCCSIYFYRLSQSPSKRSSDFSLEPRVVVDSALSPVLVTSSNAFTPDESCVDPIWCSIEMPTKSFFRFEPPSDASRWKKAQLQAALGDQVLLSRTIKTFPNHFDFIDGDISFRKLHYLFDFFIDEKRDLSPLVPGASFPSSASDNARRQLQQMSEELQNWEDVVEVAERTTVDVVINNSVTSTMNPQIKQVTKRDSVHRRQLTTSSLTNVNGKMLYEWEAKNKKVIPDPYDFRLANRAPIVSICGYTAFQRDSQGYFTGDNIGGAFIDRQTFFNHWHKVKDKIDTPFIAVCSLNENWGWVSTNFPNRTAGWGQCCRTPRDKDVWEFLNHKMTLMLVTNQHHNSSHPKHIVIPRGIPVGWGSTRVIIFDSMKNALLHKRRDKLLFATGSSWGKRPQILKCISDKMNQNDFDGHVSNSPAVRLGRAEYYEKLGSVKFGVGLSGLGYDCFR
jgi:hypothetical protein